MKKKVCQVLSCIGFLFFLLLAIGWCADRLEYKEGELKYASFYKSETNLDVIFLGTSHMWNSVLPMELWKEQGIASYNWGYSNCTPAENYYLLQDIVKYTSPKLVVMDLYGLVEYEGDGNGKYRSDRIGQQHVQFDTIPLSWNKVKGVMDVFDNYAHKEDFIWNFIMYHDRWNRMDQTAFSSGISVEKGAQFLTGLGKSSMPQLKGERTTKLDSVCYSYFLRIMQFCREKGIPLLCVYLPYGAEVHQQRVANSIEAVMDSYPEHEYLNMLHMGILDFSTDIYKDNGHLNFAGARKVTKWLGKYLADHYELDNYLFDASWHKDYESYYHYKVDNLMMQRELEDCLILLTDPDFSAQMEIYDEELFRSPLLLRLAAAAGVTCSTGVSEDGYSVSLHIVSNLDQKTICDLNFSQSNIGSELKGIVKIE